MRSIWPQKLLLMLWVKNRRVTWCESVEGTKNKVSPWSRVSWPMTMSACCWARDIPVTDQGGLQRESTDLSGVALWMPISVLSTRSLWEKERKRFLVSEILLCLIAWGPKTAGRIRKLFSLSTEDEVRLYVVLKPFNKEGKKPTTEVPKIQCLVTPRVCHTHTSTLFWSNNVLRKTRKRLQNMLNFWLRGWRRPKKNTRNQLPRFIGCPLWGLLPLSLSPSQKWGLLRVTHK